MKNFWDFASQQLELDEDGKRPELRECSKCGERKPLDDFPLVRPVRMKKMYRVRQCRLCLAAYQRAWRALKGPRPHSPRQTGPKRCPKCEKTKPAAAFHSGPESPTGLRSYCIPCSNQYSREKRAEHMHNYDGPKVERKRCTRCGETKAAADFNVKRCTKDGLHNYCRVCHRATANAEYQRNKHRRTSGRTGDKHPWKRKSERDIERLEKAGYKENERDRKART